MIDLFQSVSLVEGCLYHGIVQHEIMHALGFFHEQSRTDRNDYVIINIENVKEGYEHNFKYVNRNRLFWVVLKLTASWVYIHSTSCLLKFL